MTPLTHRLSLYPPTEYPRVDPSGPDRTSAATRTGCAAMYASAACRPTSPRDGIDANQVRS